MPKTKKQARPVALQQEFNFTQVESIPAEVATATSAHAETISRLIGEIDKSNAALGMIRKELESLAPPIQAVTFIVSPSGRKPDVAKKAIAKVRSRKKSVPANNGKVSWKIQQNSKAGCASEKLARKHLNGIVKVIADKYGLYIGSVWRTAYDQLKSDTGFDAVAEGDRNNRRFIAEVFRSGHSAHFLKILKRMREGASEFVGA